jgi:large subunit ribosomal protein L10
MAITKAKKHEIYKNVASLVKEAGSIVFVNFHGVNVTDTTQFRRALKEKGVNYIVTKKTLAKKALGEREVSGEMPVFEGELGMAYGEDQIAPAREVYEFQKKLDNKVKILGGVFEGGYKNKEEMIEIALIPSREVLLSKIAFLLKSPMQRIAIAVSEVAKKKA